MVYLFENRRLWLVNLLLILLMCSGVLQAQAGRRFPFELVQGLYYFTDQGEYQTNTVTGKVEFDETIHGSQALDFDNKLAFTFDDVVFEPYIDHLLDILKAYHIRAVFFLTATHMGKTDHAVIARYLKRMIAEGHVLGNHTWGHDTLDRGRFTHGSSGLAATQLEVTRLETVVDEILGYHYPMEYLRPPFGIRGNDGKTLGERMSLPGRVDEISHTLGRKLILWHINSLDFLMAYNPSNPEYLSLPKASAACLQRIHASKGGVILFHANHRTPAMLQAVLKGLTAADQVLKGAYSFTTVADLLEMKYGTRNIY